MGYRKDQVSSSKPNLDRKLAFFNFSLVTLNKCTLWSCEEHACPGHCGIDLPSAGEVLGGRGDGTEARGGRRARIPPSKA